MEAALAAAEVASAWPSQRRTCSRCIDRQSCSGRWRPCRISRTVLALRIAGGWEELTLLAQSPLAAWTLAAYLLDWTKTCKRHIHCSEPPS